MDEHFNENTDASIRTLDEITRQLVASFSGWLLFLRSERFSIPESRHYRRECATKRRQVILIEIGAAECQVGLLAYRSRREGDRVVGYK